MRNVICMLRSICAVAIVTGIQLVIMAIVFSYVAVTDQMVSILCQMSYVVSGVIGGILIAAQWKKKWLWLDVILVISYLSMLSVARLLTIPETGIRIVDLCRSMLIGCAATTLGNRIWTMIYRRRVG